MTTGPPATLLRLRAADVVRLCGFAAAARGLELADRHTVAGGRREGARLEATVTDGGETAPCQVAVELAGEIAPVAMRWTCSAHASAPGEPGCAHVAALLTAWMRVPGDFITDAADSATPVGRTGSPDTPEPVAPGVTSRVSQPALMPPPPARRPRTSGALADELARLPSAPLLAMARRVLSPLGVDLSEHEARAQLAAALGDSGRVAALLARLDSQAGKLLACIALLGGAITSADLDALATRSGRAPSAAQASAGVLVRHGLLFPAPGRFLPAPPGEAGSLTGWRIPPEIRAALAPALPLDPLPMRDGHAPPLPAPHDALPSDLPRRARVERGSPRALCLALALLARAPRPLGLGHSAADAASEASRASFPPSMAQVTMGHMVLVLGDLPAGRLVALARAAGLEPGLAQVARRVLLRAREQAAGQPLTDLARVPPSERALALRVGFRLWRDAEAAAELADLALPGSPLRVCFDPAQGMARPSVLGAEVAAARCFVVRLLAAAVVGAWYALDDFVTLAWRLDPLFLRARQQAFAAPAWWLERADGSEGPRRPLRPMVREEWHAAEGVWLRLLLTGPLHWWGVVDVTEDRTHAVGQPVAFRVTPFGRFLLGDEQDTPPVESASDLARDWGTAALPTREGDLAVQPLAAGAAAVLDALEDWARPTAIAGGRLLYAFVPDLACAAFDGAASTDELCKRLRVADPHGGARIAERVAERLAAWRTAYGQTRIVAGWGLLEARDEPSLLEALTLAPEIAARCRRLSPTCVLVPPADLPALQALLAKRGYAM
jgi:hypothetical protein